VKTFEELFRGLSGGWRKKSLSATRRKGFWLVNVDGLLHAPTFVNLTGLL